MLESVSDPKSVQVRGVIDDDGTFSLGSILNGQNVGGTPPGEYRGHIVLSDGRDGPEGGRRSTQSSRGTTNRASW